MTYAEYQEQWEIHAESELQENLRRPIQDLLDDAREGRHGTYYTLWQAIAARASLAEAAPTLLGVLQADRLYWPLRKSDHRSYSILTNRQQAEYLARYHCAQALLSMLGASEAELSEVDLAAERPGRKANVERIADLVEQKLRTAKR